jgi:hypothetical protein
MADEDFFDMCMYICVRILTVYVCTWITIIEPRAPFQKKKKKKKPTSRSEKVRHPEKGEKIP